MPDLTPATLAAQIDHTILNPEASTDAVMAVADEAVQHGFASVCVAPAWVKAVADRVAGRTKVCSVVGFPHGTSKPTVKAIEATAAAKDGAREIDMVLHLPLLIESHVDRATAEVREVVAGCRAVRSDIVVKVIVESAALHAADPTGDIIRHACDVVRTGGADFIKTSTGFHPAGGASEQAVKLMVEHATGLHVKASGGIRTLADCRTYLDFGATRLGMSKGIAAIAELTGGASAQDDGTY
ncbi:MAG: deoxyribose-phosphate aldolase [Planctomycetota bacterium]